MRSSGQPQLTSGLRTEHNPTVSDDRFGCFVRVLLAQNSLSTYPHISKSTAPLWEQSPVTDPEGSLPTPERPHPALRSELLEDPYLLPLQTHRPWQPLLTASCGTCQARGALAGSRGRRLQDGGFQGRWARGLTCGACMRPSSRVLESTCENLEEGPDRVLKTQQQSRGIASRDLL